MWLICGDGVNFLSLIRDTPYLILIWILGSKFLIPWSRYLLLVSGIDIAVFGEKLNFEKLLAISIDLDKIDLLQTIDLVHFEKIKEAELKKHIERVGNKIYGLELASKR